MTIICKNFTTRERRKKSRDPLRGVFEKEFKHCETKAQKRAVVKKYQPLHFIFGVKL